MEPQLKVTGCRYWAATECVANARWMPVGALPLPEQGTATGLLGALSLPVQAYPDIAVAFYAQNDRWSRTYNPCRRAQSRAMVPGLIAVDKDDH